MKDTLISIDPGSPHWMAAFNGGILRWASPFTVSDGQALAEKLARDSLVFVEQPDAIHAKVRPADIIRLAWGGGEVAGLFLANGAARVEAVPVREWKGQKKKPPCHYVGWANLSAIERSVVAIATGLNEDYIELRITEACDRLARTGKVTRYSWAAHNCLDAVCLGLKKLGRV